VNIPDGHRTLHMLTPPPARYRSRRGR
jgi:hypothetical protein